MMHLTIRWKLMGSYLLLMLLMGGSLLFYLNHTLDNYLGGQIREHLESESRLAAYMAGRGIGDLHRDGPGMADEIGRRIKARITLVATSGEVMGDSEVRRENLHGLENHGSRPEIVEALKNGSGSSIRYSSTLGTDMLYVAVPFFSTSANNGVVRLALPLSAVDGAKRKLHAILGVAFGLSVFIALVLSYILSRIASRPLQEISAIADRIGVGDFSRRLPEERRDELGKLASIMNEMSARLGSQMGRLTTEKNRLDAILRGMGEGLMVADGKGVITLVNPAFNNFFAVDEKVVGKPLIDISRHPALHSAFDKVLATKGEQIEELTLNLPAESTLLTHWVPLVEDGELRGVVAVFHDISDLKLLEKIRKDFVANVSHELRTPVSVIKGYAETLLDGVLRENPEQAIRFVEIIHSHSGRLAALISDLLTLSEMESGKFTLDLAPCRLELVARSAATLLESAASAKGISISLPEKITAQALADQGRLEQVFINLLDNAVKYTSDGGKVTVNVAEEGEMLKVSVSDTGQGIPPKDLPRIFERFYRVDSARSRAEGGTGLGLSIVKHIVQLHGGAVSVVSEVGKGTTFSFTVRKA